MQGTRKYMTLDDTGLKPGEYGKHPVNGDWYCRTPNGWTGNLKGHTVTEHEDGTITVSPSILVRDDIEELWHGYLERGIWRGV